MKKAKLTAAVLTIALTLTLGNTVSAAEAQIIYPHKDYNGMGPYRDGLASVNIVNSKDIYNKYREGYIDRSGREVIPCKYLRADNFADGLARVFTGEAFEHQYGYIDTSGKQVLPQTSYGDDGSFTLGDDGAFHDGLAVINSPEYDAQMVANRSGKVLLRTVQGDQAKVDGWELSGELCGLEGYPAYATESLGGGYFTYRVAEYRAVSAGSKASWTTLPTLKAYGENWGDWRKPVFYGDAKGSLYFFPLGQERPFYAFGSRVIDRMVLVQDVAGKYGVATLEEKLVLPVEYDVIRWSGYTALNTIFPACKDGVWKGITIDGENKMPWLATYQDVKDVIIAPAGYVLIEQKSDPQKQSQWTALDYNGTVLIPTWAGNASACGDFICQAYNENGKWIYRDYGSKGNLISMGAGWKSIDDGRTERDSWEMGLRGSYNPTTRQLAFQDETGAVVIPPVAYGLQDAIYDSVPAVGYASEGRIGLTGKDGRNGYLVVPGWTDMQAKPSNYKIMLNEKETSAATYEISGNVFIKLRDLAMLLKDTPTSFAIEKDSRGPLRITTGSVYTPVGGELSGIGNGGTAKLSASSVYCNGDHTSTLGYSIGGSNYHKLTDIAKLLNINIAFDKASGVIAIDTTMRYGA